MNKTLGRLLLPLVLVLFGFTSAYSHTSVGFGFSVGNYDYYPYTHSSVGLSVGFNDVLGDYGSWVSVPRFGRAWRPYAAAGWRPYEYGHWAYTSYGPYWEGYEPWAWVGYHYGHWIWTQEFGWVWLPGYDWSPGDVVWGYGYNSIGWMPAPPAGYSYGCGYLSYGDCGYSDPFYSPRFSNIGFNLFVFIDRHRFFNDNYADYYLGRDYTRNLLARRLVRIERRPIQRVELERIVGRRVAVEPVRVKEIRMQNRTVKAVIPAGGEVRIRRNGERVVKQVIAPAMAQKKRTLEARQNEKVKGVSRNDERRIEVNRSNKTFAKETRRIEPMRSRNERDKQFEVHSRRNYGRNSQAKDLNRERKDHQFQPRESGAGSSGFIKQREQTYTLHENKGREFEARRQVERKPEPRMTEQRRYEPRDKATQMREQKRYQPQMREQKRYEPQPRKQQRYEPQPREKSMHEMQPRNEPKRQNNYPQNQKSKSEKKPKKVRP